MYLLTYDIANPKRLREVAKICEKYLIRVQKSVFEGDLTEAQKYALWHDLETLIDAKTDAIALYYFPKVVIKKKTLLGIIPADPYLIGV